MNMKQLVDKTLKINTIVFPYLIGLTYFFLILESYMYIGFLRKFFLMDSRFFLIFSIFSIIITLFSRLKDENYIPSSLESFVLDINALLLFPILIFYWIMIVSNADKYSNYVFASFHIQPQNFLYIVFLSLALFILRSLKISADKRKFILQKTENMLRMLDKVRKLLFFMALMFMSLVFYAISNLSNTLGETVNSTVFISTHLDYSFDDKMRKNWGFYYDYMRFVASHTKPDSVILIPPQSGHWLSTGNEGLSRYFLYPRNLVHGDTFSIPRDGYDYVLIARGEWYNDTVDWGWPKVPVKAEEIWYINPTTLEVTEVKKDFDPKNPINMQSWGLIKVRKEIQK